MTSFLLTKLLIKMSVAEFTSWFETSTILAFQQQQDLKPICSILSREREVYFALLDLPDQAAKEAQLRGVRTLCKQLDAIGFALATEAYAISVDQSDSLKRSLIDELGAAMMADREELLVLNFELKEPVPTAYLKQFKILRDAEAARLKFKGELDLTTSLGLLTHMLP